MVLLAVESLTWPQILLVTGLGFGIVLVLLCCLVFILKGLGMLMQRVTAPKATKESKQTSDDMAAVAMALHLFKDASKHDEPTAMITFNKRDTAWNPKSEGFNNVGF